MSRSRRRPLQSIIFRESTQWKFCNVISLKLVSRHHTPRRSTANERRTRGRTRNVWRRAELSGFLAKRPRRGDRVTGQVIIFDCCDAHSMSPSGHEPRFQCPSGVRRRARFGYAYVQDISHQALRAYGEALIEHPQSQREGEHQETANKDRHRLQS